MEIPPNVDIKRGLEGVIFTETYLSSIDGAEQKMKELRDRAAYYLVNPRISVSIGLFRPYYLMGEVGRTGAVGRFDIEPIRETVLHRRIETRSWEEPPCEKLLSVLQFLE